MPTSRPAALAVAAAAAFVGEAVAELVHHQADHFASAGDYVVEALFGAALLLGAAASLALRSAAASTPRGRAATVAAAAGYLALAVCSAATIVHGSDALGPLFVLGLLVSVLAPIALAAADPALRRAGLALAVGLVASSAIPHGGAAVLGLAWLAAVALPAGAQRRKLVPA